MSTLVVITGPIGAGKSSVAEALGSLYKEVGLSAAVVDLDDTVATLRAPLEQFEESWDRARRVHGDLIRAWLDAGVDAVIAHGPFYSAAETAALMRDVPADVPPRRVMLLVPVDVALARVQQDEGRGFSKDPSFLRSTHERFATLTAEIDTCEWTFDTTEVSVAEIASVLARDLIPSE